MGKLDAAREAEILYTYFDLGYSAAETAAKVKVSHVTVFDCIKRNGLQPRTKQETARLRLERRKVEVAQALAAKRSKDGSGQDRQGDERIQSGNAEVIVGETGDFPAAGPGDRDLGSQI
jgi:predicted DNA-binding protein YlxM (UPF0122 family)